MRRIIRLGKGLFDGLLVLVILSALGLVLMPRLLGAKLLVVLSQSMEPKIPMGSVVISRPVEYSEITVGDVITFQSPDPALQSALITHRVVELVGSGITTRFRTQGDAVEDPDLRLVSPHHLVGRVWFSLPYLGYGVHFMRTPLGFILLLGLPTILLVGGELKILINGTGKRSIAASQKAPISKNTRQQGIRTPSLGAILRNVIRTKNKPSPPMPTTNPEPPVTAVSSPIPASNHYAATAQDGTTEHRVQVLEAQVKALQDEVTLLRRQLAHISPDLPELKTFEPLQVSTDSEAHTDFKRISNTEIALQSEFTDHNPKGSSSTKKNAPLTAKDRPARKQALGNPIERLAANLPRWGWLGILANLIAFFLLVNFGLPRILPNPRACLIARCLLWSCIAVQALLCWQFGLENRIRPTLSAPLIAVSGILGAFQLALLLGVGLLFDFDQSPESTQFLTVLVNIAHIGMMLTGMEISRAYLLAVRRWRHPWLMLSLVSIMLSLTIIPIARFSAATFWHILGVILLPTLCQNLLASFLARVGGPVTSLVYLAPLWTFAQLSPIQPYPKWITSILNSLIPILALPIIHNLLPRLLTKNEDANNWFHRKNMNSSKRSPFALPIIGKFIEAIPARDAEQTTKKSINSQERRIEKRKIATP